MTAAQVVIVVRLLAGLYAVDAQMMDCIAMRESDYNVNAQNGIHIGVMQWSPSTLAWLGGKVQADPLWLHGHMDSTEPVYQIALSAWAIRNNYGSHWATFSMCEEG